MAVLHQAVIFFLLMLVGVYARRTKMITPENQQQLSAIVVNIAYPAIILSSALSDGERIGSAELLAAVLAAAAVILFAAAGGVLAARLLGCEEKQRGGIIAMTVFTNIGFMGVPMIQTVYGADALIYMTVFLIPFNLLFFSCAVPLIRGKGPSAPADREPALKPSLLARLRGLFNNGMIACFLAVILYFADLPVPAPLGGTIEMLGLMTAPLAMLLMGSFLVDVDWLAALREPRTILYCLFKMIVLPVAAVRLLSLGIENKALLGVSMAALATPCGNVTALLSAIYNRDAYPTAVKCIALSTFASVATMPIAFALAGLA